MSLRLAFVRPEAVSKTDPPSATPRRDPEEGREKGDIGAGPRCPSLFRALHPFAATRSHFPTLGAHASLVLYGTRLVPREEYTVPLEA